MTWWQELYDDRVADLLLERREPAELAAITTFLIDRLKLEAGVRVFDQCCGTGTLTRTLTDAGYRVTGIDQAAGYIARARNAAPGAAFETADAAEYVCRPPCRSAFNWGTSFGYSMSDTENQAMLARAFDSIRPGGRFALDVLALPGVLRNFQPAMIDRSDDVVLTRETEIDPIAGSMNKQWTFVHANGEVTIRYSKIRLYLPHQIAELVAGVGFDIVEMCADHDGAPLTIDSCRCIVVGQKPMP